MNKDIIKELEKSIINNAKKSTRPDCKADEALKFTQAAQNAAHSIHVLRIIEDELEKKD